MRGSCIDSSKKQQPKCLCVLLHLPKQVKDKQMSEQKLSVEELETLIFQIDIMLMNEAN